MKTSTILVRQKTEYLHAHLLRTVAGYNNPNSIFYRDISHLRHTVEHIDQQIFDMLADIPYNTLTPTGKNDVKLLEHELDRVIDTYLED